MSARALLELLLPLRCLGCGEGVGGGARTPICPSCRTRVRPLPSPRCGSCGTPMNGAEPCGFCEDWPDDVTALSATRMVPPADALVHALKGEGWRGLAPWLAGRMVAALPPAVREAGELVVVPVPTPPKRLRGRGFNPAGLLASAVAERLDRPCVDALVRPVDGPRQAGLPAHLRPANVRYAFSPEPRHIRRIRDRKIILVDDVLTTGATVIEAARVLLAHGAGTVRVLTFARAAPTRPGELRRAS